MTTSDPSDSFSQRYGRVALIAGASEGVGACLAEQLAGEGLDLFLVARNGPLLEDVAAGIRQRHGVEARTAVLDLTDPGIGEHLGAATAGLEVGLLIYNAGAVNHIAPLFNESFEFWLTQIKLNCIGPLALVRQFGPAMLARGRGGIILVGSTGCFAGTPNIVVYSAAKMFEVNFAEGIWAELHPYGVDVCCAVIGGTDTPARARYLGVEYDPDTDMMPDEVARQILDNIANGPAYVVGEANRALGGGWLDYRRAGMAAVSEAMRVFGERKPAGGA
jgi:short-subunit dehydrogenase